MIERAVRPGEIIAQFPPFSVIGQYNSSLMDALFPSINTLQRVAIALFSWGCWCPLAGATFYLPDNPIPITFQTTGVLLMGGVLGLRWGLFAILVYYFLGMAAGSGVQGRRQRLALCLGNGHSRLSHRIYRGGPPGGVFVPAGLEPRPSPVAHALGESVSYTCRPFYGFTTLIWAGPPRGSFSAEQCTPSFPATWSS